jgi:hypothetical protein
MSARLRASAYPYTAYHIPAAASRFEAAVIEAACVWHEASRNLTDVGNALETANDDGDERLAHMLEFAKDSAMTYCEYAFQQVRALVCAFEKPDSWEGLASNGLRYRVNWSGPIIAQISIIPQN